MFTPNQNVFLQEIIDKENKMDNEKQNNELLKELGDFVPGTKGLVDNMIKTGKEPTQEEIEEAQEADIIIGLLSHIARKAAGNG